MCYHKHLFSSANIPVIIFLHKIFKKTDRQSYLRILQRFEHVYVLCYCQSVYDIEIGILSDFSIFPTNSVFGLRVSSDMDFIMAGVIETYVKWNPISGKCSWAFFFC